MTTKTAQDLLDLLLELQTQLNLTELTVVDTSFSDIKQITIATDDWSDNGKCLRLSVIEDN